MKKHFEKQREKAIRQEARELAAAAVFNLMSNLPERVKNWTRPEQVLLSHEITRLSVLLHNDGQQTTATGGGEPARSNP